MDHIETLRQLTLSNNPINRLTAMIGAKNFMRSDNENFVSFKFSAKAKNKANYLKIRLLPSDTYSLEFGSIRGLTYTVKSTIECVYCDQLKDIFESETGLYLSLN